MFFFPLCNLIFLILLYKVQKKVFIVTAIIELLLNGIGIYYIYTHFALATKRTLAMLALTGAGLIVAFIAFFIAIIRNQKELYKNHE